jgi:hypothetical protein
MPTGSNTLSPCLLHTGTARDHAQCSQDLHGSPSFGFGMSVLRVIARVSASLKARSDQASCRLSRLLAPGSPGVRSPLARRTVGQG